MKKRILSVLLALMLVISLVPSHVHAEEECEHVGVWTYYADWSHTQKCSKCGETLVSDGRHEMDETDTCQICGFKSCTEPHTPGTDHVCTGCGVLTICYDENGDCKCDLCGESYHNSRVTARTETQHRVECFDCGEGLTEWTDHSMSSGRCLSCGYGCEHEHEGYGSNASFHASYCLNCASQYNVEAHTVQWTVYENGYHSGECTVCGYCIADRQEHTLDEDGKCTVCGATPCEYGAHTFGEDHICTTCGAISDCRDRDGDGTCDICGKCLDHLWVWVCTAETCAQVCVFCEEPVSSATPHRVNSDTGYCECGYGCPHEHVGYVAVREDCHTVWCLDCGAAQIAAGKHNGGDWVHDEAGLHCQFCQDCGYKINEDWHDLDENGKCTVCDAAPCAEEHNIGADHLCTVCGAVSYCRDEDNDCACDICDCDMHGLELWEHNETKHRVVCMECGEALQDWSEHYLDENGVCYNCGYGCDHEDVSFNYYDETYHLTRCYDCGHYIAEEAHSGSWHHDEDGYHWEACDGCGTWMAEGYHKLKDGKCTECGAKPCADGVHTPGKDHICTGCGAETYCADQNRDCVCDICEAEMHAWEFDRNETHHGDLCPKCGEYDWKEEHYDSDGVGGCDYCGYGCKHNETELQYGYNYHIQMCLECGWELTDYERHTWKDGKCTVCGQEACKHEAVEWYHDATGYHYSICPECSVMVDYPALHTLVNGVCSVCEAEPCADGKHICEGPCYQCDTCGAYLTCVDTDGDCICDVCKEELHPDEDYDCVCDNGCGYDAHAYGMIMGHNDAQHWEVCYSCGATRKAENHTLVDGVCYECGYGCKHEHVWNRNWYSHFLHFWECKDCGYIGANLGDHVDANGDHLCDLCNYDRMHILEEIPQVDATCTTDGVKAHYVCRLCNRYYADAEGKIPAVDVDLTIPAAHSYKDGVCTVCGGKDPLYVKIEVAEDVPEVKVELPVDDLLTEEDKAAMAAGATVTVELTVENLSEAVTGEHKEAIEALLATIAQEKQAAVEVGVNETATVETVVVMYLDINLMKTVGDAQATAITETSSKIRFTIEIPAEYLNAANGVTREFVVIRVHGDEVTELKDLDNDPNTVTIETDRFSTYALAYSDTTVADASPKTGDAGIGLALGLALACACAFVLTKKKEF